MFYVDLEPMSNNKGIYDLQFIHNMKITVEPLTKETPFSNAHVANCMATPNHIAPGLTNVSVAEVTTWHSNVVKPRTSHPNAPCAQVNTLQTIRAVLYTKNYNKHAANQQPNPHYPSPEKTLRSPLSAHPCNPWLTALHIRKSYAATKIRTHWWSRYSTNYSLPRIQNHVLTTNSPKQSNPQHAHNCHKYLIPFWPLSPFEPPRGTQMDIWTMNPNLPSFSTTPFPTSCFSLKPTIPKKNGLKYPKLHSLPLQPPGWLCQRRCSCHHSCCSAPLSSSALQNWQNSGCCSQHSRPTTVLQRRRLVLTISS